MTTPCVRRLRERFPSAWIAVLTPSKLKELWSAHRAINEVITFEPGDSPWKIGRGLRTFAFDTALVLPNSPRSALEVWWAGVPRRVGLAHPLRNFFLTHRVSRRPGKVEMRKRSIAQVKQLAREQVPVADLKPTPLTREAHQLHDYLHLGAAMGASASPCAPTLDVDPTWLAQVWAGVASRHASIRLARECRAIAPGAEYGPAKRWPAERFPATARKLDSSRPGGCWLIVGSGGDASVCASVAERIGNTAVNLAGRTSISELMAALRHSRVLLTNDSGSMHLAAALGTPVVALFGSTSSDLTGPGIPGDPHHSVLQGTATCSPCFLRECPIDFRCMTSLSVEHATQAVERALQFPDRL
jgi:lipopolysaccharide heptosyltransferase II